MVVNHRSAKALARLRNITLEFHLAESLSRQLLPKGGDRHDPVAGIDEVTEEGPQSTRSGTAVCIFLRLACRSHPSRDRSSFVGVKQPAGSKLRQYFMQIDIGYGKAAFASADLARPLGDFR